MQTSQTPRRRADWAILVALILAAGTAVVTLAARSSAQMTPPEILVEG